MSNEIFYEYDSSTYGDGILLNEYRNEFSLVAAKSKDGEIYMEWVFPQKRGPKTEAIKVLKFFLEKLEGDTSFSDDIPDDNRGKDGPYDDDIPF
jgi:hypothetical protein